MNACKLLNIFIIILNFNTVLSLYEDQIGKFDWKQNYLGRIQFGKFDSVKRVVVASYENVIASLNLKSGQIVWRQLLESPATNQIELLHVDQEIITVSSGEGTSYVRGWELHSGTLLWEWTLYYEKGVTAKWLVWKDQLVHVVPVMGSHLEVTLYDVRTGRNSGKTLKISTPWVVDLSNCILTGAYWACISTNDSSGQLYYTDILLQTNKVYNYAIQSLIGSAPGDIKIKGLDNAEGDLLLIRNGAGRYIRLQPELPHTFSYSLAPNVGIAPNGDQTILLQFTDGNEENSIQLRTTELHEGAENTIEITNSKELKVANVITALCRGTACRVVFTTEDDMILLLQLPAGKILWTREEALSHIVSAKFLELPVSELDASIEQEFNEFSGDGFGMLYHRLSSQFRQISVVLTGQQGNANAGLVRDDFGLQKLIIVVTSVGKLYALHTLNGEIVWSKYLPDIVPFSTLSKDTVLLFIQRTARYTPLPAQCTLLVQDKVTGQGVVYIFDPITGKSLHFEKLAYRITQAMLLPFENDKHLKGLLIVSEDGDVKLYPETTKSVLLEHASSIFLYTVNPKHHNLQGFSLMHSTTDNLKATPTWALNLGQAELIAVGVKPFIERVHSQGRVLADRSVLYKYVNPNLIAVATIMDDPIHKHVLNIYLVDGVTGLIVYSVTHKRANKPVHLVHSENWLVYSYYNERFRRIELAAVEFYEGEVQNNSTAFSSHAVKHLPGMETQAYIFPGTPLDMKATITERGITSKHILVALSNGAVIEVPWAFLEPRNPDIHHNPEEGYIPYIPELPIPSEATINYNQSIARIKGIQVAPARLESTCLVLVYGLDLYYTRVTPSKTFDLLKEDFDHWLIAVVLIGLTLASYITKQLAARKALKQAWK